MTATSPALYTLAAEYAAIVDAIKQGEGEILDDMEARLDAIQGAMKDKIEALQFIYRDLAASADTAKGRADAYEAQYVTPYRMEYDHLDAEADRVKKYTQRCMELAARSR